MHPARYIAPALLTLLLPATSSYAAESCIYQSTSGEFKVADGLSEVPAGSRENAICQEKAESQQSAETVEEETPEVSSKARSRKSASHPRIRFANRGGSMAMPQDIELSGNIRRERFNSSLGPIDLRWPRTAETLFGRTPMRAMADAARTVSRASRTSAFPLHIQQMKLDWKVIFMDADLPSTQIPAYLRMTCHPGWMVPPANIYIVAQRVAGNCGTSRKDGGALRIADARLTEILVHEIAHALEFHLLHGNPPGMNRMRSEGFATWFETFAADYSSLMNRRDLQERHARWAATSMKQSPGVFAFGGSAFDYARASMLFSAVEDRYGVSGVIRVYDEMYKQRSELIPTLKGVYNWGKKRRAREVERVVKKQKG